MKSLVFLDPKITEKLLAGHQDVLGLAVEKQETFYAVQTCPRCAGSCRKYGTPRQPFANGELLPQFYLQCLACGCEFDPKTNIIIKLGNIGQAVEPAYPILKTKDD